MKNSWAVRDATDEVLELFAQLGVKNIVVNYQNCVLFRHYSFCLLYTSPSPRDGLLSRMPSSA